MLRLIYSLLSVLLLLMSLTDPKSKWPIGGVDLYGYFFVFCVVLYVPLMVATFVLFVRSLVVLFRAKSLRAGFFSMAAASMGAIALYSFNYWVFSEIY